jgi:hypothetical protein
MLLRSRDCRSAAYAALPDGIGDLGLPLWSVGNGEVGEEEKIKKCVYKLFDKRLRIFVLLRGRFGLNVLSPVEQHLVGNRRPPGWPAARRPEQLFLPPLQCLLLVDKRENSRQNADAVQRFSIGSEFGIGEGGVVTKQEQAVGHSPDEGL